MDTIRIFSNHIIYFNIFNSLDLEDLNNLYKTGCSVITKSILHYIEYKPVVLNYIDGIHEDILKIFVENDRGLILLKYDLSENFLNFYVDKQKDKIRQMYNGCVYLKNKNYIMNLFQTIYLM